GAVAQWSPGKPQLAADLDPQLGLVEVAGALCLAVEMGRVQRRVAAVGTTGEVGGKQVGVQLRVADPRGAVLEGGGDQAVGVVDMLAAGAAADEGGLMLEVGERGGDGAAVGTADAGAGLGIAKRPEERDRLRGREGEVKAGNAAAAAIAEERLAAARILA